MTTKLISRLALAGVRVVVPVFVLSTLFPGCGGSGTMVTIHWGPSYAAYKPRATVRLADGRTVQVVYGNTTLDPAAGAEVTFRSDIAVPATETAASWFRKYLKARLESRAAETTIDPDFERTFGRSGWCLEQEPELDYQGEREGMVASPEVLEGADLGSCAVVDGLAVHPSPLVFDPQSVGVISALRTIELTNNLDGMRKCLAIVGVEAPNAGDFYRPADNPGTCVQNQMDELHDDCIYLDSHLTCTVNLIFIPSRHGSRLARLRINDTGRRRAVSLEGTGVGGTLQVVEAGYGIAPPAVYLPVDPSDSDICVAPAGGGIYSAWIRIRNTGTGYVTLPSPVSAADGWSLDWVTPPPGASFSPLAPGAQIEFQLRFDPPAPGDVPRSMRVSISGNQQNDPLSFNAVPQATCPAP